MANIRWFHTRYLRLQRRRHLSFGAVGHHKESNAVGILNVHRFPWLLSGLSWPMEQMTPLRLSGTWIRHFWHRQRVTPSRTIRRPLTWQLAGNLHNEHVRIENRQKTLMTQPTNREVAQRTCRNRERPLGHSTDNGLTSKCVRRHARVSASNTLLGPAEILDRTGGLHAISNPTGPGLE